LKRRPLCQTLSKSLETSQKTNLTSLPLSILLIILWYISISWLTVELFNKTGSSLMEDIAHVSPIFKGKGNPHSPQNYRPISVTSILCKIMEKLYLNTYLIIWNQIISCQSVYLAFNQMTQLLINWLKYIIISLGNTCFNTLKSWRETFRNNFLLSIWDVTFNPRY
jgi:hypothetical protein